ncbi:Zinc finger protein castor 1, variant 2 [Dermatophagoides farinae]|uniref:Zinc finger protein castor 1, variant 2 n=1 Tax=Dermatophagoides farinae TaxID=6954 RepID=A0A922HUH5_DERFA|nr:Zinc finger protein castor 1, variant 2 [Dermatophagoides farinae]
MLTTATATTTTAANSSDQINSHHHHHRLLNKSQQQSMTTTDNILNNSSSNSSSSSVRSSSSSLSFMPKNSIKSNLDVDDDDHHHLFHDKSITGDNHNIDYDDDEYDDKMSQHQKQQQHVPFSMSQQSSSFPLLFQPDSSTSLPVPVTSSLNNDDDDDDDNNNVDDHKSQSPPSSSSSSSPCSTTSSSFHDNNNQSKMITMNEMNSSNGSQLLFDETFNVNETDNNMMMMTKMMMMTGSGSSNMNNNNNNNNISVQTGNSGKNKRKNFKPRCIEPETSSTTTAAAAALIAQQSQLNRIMNESSMNDDPQQQLFQNLFNDNSTMKNNISGSGGNSSLITNSILTQLFNDMNNHHNSQQQQQQQRQPNQSLDLLDQQQQQQQQMQQLMLQQIQMQMHQQQQQQQQQQSKNHLFELFLMKSMRNQFQQQERSGGGISTITKSIPSSSSSSSLSSIIEKKLQSKLIKYESNSSDNNKIKRGSKRKSNANSMIDNNDDVNDDRKLMMNISHNNDSNFMDHLLQLYSFNRENYLKFLQQQIPQLSSSSSSSMNSTTNQSIRMMMKNTDGQDDHHNRQQQQQQRSSPSSSSPSSCNQQQIKNHADNDDDLENENHEIPVNNSMDNNNHHRRRTIMNFTNSDDGINDDDQYKTIRNRDHSSIIDQQQRQQQQQQSSSSSSSINVDKLKQLQQLYKLNLIQHLDGVQQQQQHSTTTTSSSSVKLNPFTESMFLFHQQQQQKQQQQSNNLQEKIHKPSLLSMNLIHNDITSNGNYNDNLSSSSSTSTTTTMTTTMSMSMANNKSEIKIDNITYVKDLFRNKVINAKSSSRRPLSSWKQSINACGPGPAPWIEKSTLHSLGIQGELINKSCPIDYTHYVKRYANANECGNSICKELSYREHFHCNALSCNSRVFMKKEEMIRHFKWHKKRDESLTHGFLRCSPGDNCIERFKNCPHHRKQTHYHCLKRGCDKVYISTSDVQMHANYHRKDTAIIQEGFQRFRATENCLLECCAFFGQKTTHFHCRRDNCLHTFKNKADMEKHKSYHVRDEQLARDGFKKFMKHESCLFDDCRSSRVCNHIHCVRSGCTHVLHSTGQLYPHKRKHDRCEKELAYRKYRLAQSIHCTNEFDKNNSAIQNRLASYGIDLDINLLNIESFEQSLLNKDDDNVFDEIQDQLPLMQISTIPIEDIIGDDITDIRCAKYIQKHQRPNEQCTFIDDDGVQVIFNDDDDDGDGGGAGGGGGGGGRVGEHYNCLNCNVCFNDQMVTLKHARKHVLQDEITSLMFEETTNDSNICNVECLLYQSVRHLHCRMYGCIFILPIQDKTLKKFEHYKFHEELQCNYSFDSDESAFANLSGYLSLENPPLPQPQQQQQPPTPSSSLSSQSTPPPQPVVQPILLPPPPPPPPLLVTKSKPTSMNKCKTTSTSLQQIYPTGTMLTTVDGMPILKRKRGRPPKNRSNEMLTTTKVSATQSKNNSKTNQSTPTATIQPATTAMSSFDLAQAFNLPLNHVQFLANFPQTADDLSKTIPIPFIMPYIKSSIHSGFYVFDEETICPDVTCIHLGRKHFHCSRPRCFYSTNRDDKLVDHSKDFHDNIDILEGFIYFDQNIDCKSEYCQYNHSDCHFHCTRIGCNYSFVRYSSMAIHEREHMQKFRSSSTATTRISDQKTIDDDNHHNHSDDGDDGSDECSPMLTIRSSTSDMKFDDYDDDDDDDDDDDGMNDKKLEKNNQNDNDDDDQSNDDDDDDDDLNHENISNGPNNNNLSQKTNSVYKNESNKDIDNDGEKDVNDMDVNSDSTNVLTLQQSLQKLLQSRMGAFGMLAVSSSSSQRQRLQR